MSSRTVRNLVILAIVLSFSAGAVLAVMPGGGDEAAAGRPCKSCKDRAWCGCTYNGLPRVSCTPCCYGNLGIPQVCFD